MKDKKAAPGAFGTAIKKERKRFCMKIVPQKQAYHWEIRHRNDGVTYKVLTAGSQERAARLTGNDFREIQESLSRVFKVVNSAVRPKAASCYRLFGLTGSVRVASRNHAYRSHKRTSGTAAGISGDDSSGSGDTDDGSDSDSHQPCTRAKSLNSVTSTFQQNHIKLVYRNRRYPRRSFFMVGRGRVV
jgi:hypothetical protein